MFGKSFLLLPLALMVATTGTLARDHRESEYVAEHPKIDGTDLFAFRSYEQGREDFIVLSACYQPLQAPFAGPHCYTMDPDAAYDIHVDKDGDGVEDITFRFKFGAVKNEHRMLVGSPSSQRLLSRPLLSAEPVPPGSSTANEMALGEIYTLEVITYGRGAPTRTPVYHETPSRTGACSSQFFNKASDYFGERSIPDYESYAAAHVYDVVFPLGFTGRLFVGPRKDPRVFNMGETFDLFGEPLTGVPYGRDNALEDFNVVQLALEIPVPELDARERVLGIWTTASLPHDRSMTDLPRFDGVDTEFGPGMQVSRVGAPLVNSFLIGLADKDAFNCARPVADAHFRDYFTHPVLPEIIQDLRGFTAPEAFPRMDLVDFYLRGLPGLTQTAAEAEMLRLAYAVPPRMRRAQDRLGVLGGDLAGYPNGRRPGDDVVDITLRVLMGANLPARAAPDGGLDYTDGALVSAGNFDNTFPFLRTPTPGAVQTP